MSTAAAGPAHFVLVATPIGNLGDLSPRAVETLAAARAFDLAARWSVSNTFKSVVWIAVDVPVARAARPYVESLAKKATAAATVTRKSLTLVFRLLFWRVAGFADQRHTSHISRHHTKTFSFFYFSDRATGFITWPDLLNRPH